MSTIEIPNTYKKNYKIEKYRDELCNKLVSLNGDDISYKLIFGASPELFYVREKVKVNHYDLMQRKMKFRNILKLYELSFNNKIKKFSNNYITNMFDLLSHRDNNYVEKRKNLIETNNKYTRNKRIKLLKKTFLFPFTKINNNTINYNPKNSQSTLSNESNLKLNKINIKNISNNSTIRESKRNKKNVIKRKNISSDYEYNFDDGNEEQNIEKSVFEKLKKENKFFKIDYNKSDNKLKNVMQRIKKVPKFNYLNNNYFSKKEKTIERMKNSSSCDNDYKTNKETNNYKFKKIKFFNPKNKILKFSNSSINLKSKFPFLKSNNKNIFLINGKEYEIDK